MNIKDFQERISVRDYTDEKMSKQDMDDLIKAINNSPTSTNAQQFSAIIVTDQETKDFISKNNYGQKHIAEAAGLILFFGDRTRNDCFLENGIEDEDIKLLAYQRATVDAAIAATYAQDALMALGYGNAYIGGLQGYAPELKKHFNLPKNMFPVTGLSFGKTKSVNGFKHKINKVYIDSYSKDQVVAEAEQYNKEMADYYKARGVEGRDFASQNRVEANPEKGIGKPFAVSGRNLREIIKEWEK